jgi:ribose transport system permease protein
MPAQRSSGVVEPSGTGSTPVPPMTGPAAESAPPQPGHGTRVASELANLPVPIVLLVLIAVFSILSPHVFFTVSNLQVILGTQAVGVLLALAVTVALAANEFDLSIASVLAFSGVALGWLTVTHHWPVGAAIPVVLAIGLLIGAVNAVLVVKVGMGSFITTLGTGTLLLGLAAKLTNSAILIGLPHFVSTISTDHIAGVQVAFYFGLGMTIVLWYLLEHTPVGRWTIFVGAGPDTARLTGLPVNGLRSSVLILSAGIAALAGILQAGLSASADPNAGASSLLPAFAAAFLGATTFKRGRFNMWGTFLAVYMVSVGITGLQITTGATGWIVDVFNGGVLVAAVAASRVLTRNRAARD